MPTAPYISIIIPAYNEVQSINRTLDAVLAYLEGLNESYEIIVSADGNDGTRELVRDRAAYNARLSIIGSVERRGKGHGVRSGVALARGQIIGFVDADYKTPIEDLAKIIPWFDRGYDVVFGSRAMAESQIERKQPLYRQIGSRAFGIVMHLTVGLWGISDTQCGFKFFRGSVAHDLFNRQQVDGYMFDVEILYLAEQSNYQLKEVGVRWRDDGDSRLNLVAGNWRNMLDILRIRFKTPSPAKKQIFEEHEL